MKGIVFLVPGRMPCAARALDPPGTTSQTAAPGPRTVLAREQGEGAFLSWEEILACPAPGLFEFQSHTLLPRPHPHHAAPGGLHDPGAAQGLRPLRRPLDPDDGRDLPATEVPLGTPLLGREPRLSDSLRFYEEPERTRGLRRRRGGARGRGLLPQPRLGGAAPTRWWGAIPSRAASRRAEERDAAIRARARGVQEGRSRTRTGKPVSHLCYPWHVAGRRPATARARRSATGPPSAARCAGAPISRSGGDLHQIARLGEDYVEAAPRPRAARTWRASCSASGPAGSGEGRSKIPPLRERKAFVANGASVLIASSPGQPAAARAPPPRRRACSPRRR